ncbi:TetR family transcriptional regulator [Arthrobacter agilis]|uniref:TetR/AcrR family transcriptional regulator n=1 Tax=Arthrobacter agilis TaxID=37921 RepID=UPI0023656491|nr:TetR family transcriptional regulator [Arthrobacter agilis]WDF34209.1 TetR family transcriptional regulator [Arthrobacter agilis]
MESANTEDLGLRERKRRQTRSSIVSTARRLTLAHGLSGFTVEQVCDDVGISRRTFFNYFPAKEDAVLGSSDEDLPQEVLDAFVESGSASPPRPLLDALADLFAEFGSRMAMSRDEYEAMSAVLHREPQLLAKMFARAESKSQLLTGLIRERESLPAGHPAPRVATIVLGGLARRSLDEFFEDGNELSYPQVIRRNIDALRYLFSPDSPPTGRRSAGPPTSSPDPFPDPFPDFQNQDTP